VPIEGYQAAGSYSLDFGAGKYNLTSGVYFYRLKSEEVSITKKMLLLK